MSKWVIQRNKDSLGRKEERISGKELVGIRVCTIRMSH